MVDKPEFGFCPGDWVAYRCSGCGDRWDMEVADDAIGSREGDH
jgi:hypothetical protein